MVQNFRISIFPEKGNPGITHFVSTAFIVMNAMGTEWVTPWILRMQKRLFFKKMDKFVEILYGSLPK